MGIDFAFRTRYSHLSIFNDRPKLWKCVEIEIDGTKFERLDLKRLKRSISSAYPI